MTSTYTTAEASEIIGVSDQVLILALHNKRLPEVQRVAFKRAFVWTGRDIDHARSILRESINCCIAKKHRRHISFKIRSMSTEVRDKAILESRKKISAARKTTGSWLTWGI